MTKSFHKPYKKPHLQSSYIVEEDEKIEVPNIIMTKPLKNPINPHLHNPPFTFTFILKQSHSGEHLYLLRNPHNVTDTAAKLAQPPFPLS